MEYTVLVGNIGIVYRGKEKHIAYQIFNSYTWYSIQGIGRAAHESVTLFKDDEITDEHLKEKK